MKGSTITILLIVLIISCKKEPVPEPKNELYSEWENYFDTLDYETPENRYYIGSMAKYNDDELIFSAGHRLNYLEEGKDALFLLINNKVMPIDSSKFFVGYNHLLLNEEQIDKHIYTNQDYLFIYDKDESGPQKWLISNLHDKHNSARGQIDQQGNIWITSNTKQRGDGLHKYNGNSWVTWFNGISFYSVCFDRNGVLYASTLPGFEERGIIMRYDNNIWDTVVTCSGNAKWVPCMSFDNENNLWFGVLSRWAVAPESGDGVYKFDGKHVTNYNIYNSQLPCNSVIDIFIDETDNKWIGTYTGGLIKYSSEGKWKIYYKGITPLPNSSVEHILIDNKKNIWLSVQFFGLTRFKE